MCEPEQEPLNRRLQWPDANRLTRAILLSPSIDVCESLLRGEHVPLERLDIVWVRRYGLERAAA
jgi:hypothetical protein